MSWVSRMTHKGMNPVVPLRIGGWHWLNRFVLAIGLLAAAFLILPEYSLDTRGRGTAHAAASVIGRDGVEAFMPIFMLFAALACTFFIIAAICKYSPYAEYLISEGNLMAYGYAHFGFSKSRDRETYSLTTSCALHLMNTRQGQSLTYTVRLYVPGLRSATKSVVLCPSPKLENALTYAKNLLPQLNISPRLVIDETLQDSRAEIDRLTAQMGIDYEFGRMN